MFRLLLLGIFAGFATFVDAQHLIQNLRASYDVPTDSFIIDWQFSEQADHVTFTVRHRLRREDQWKLARSAQNQIRLTVPQHRNGDELIVQVQAERLGQVIEDWSQELIISIKQKISFGGVLVDENELLPPLEFKAHILSPTTVKLQWKPSENRETDLYYVVNVKQLTSESGTALSRQQIKTVATSFTLGRLVPGERYEMTIRTGSERRGAASSTAAIVEIGMPREEEYFEIGNLIISSHFHGSGQGVVNLTWDVPPHMVNRIVAYDVQYVEVGSNNWQRIQFHGARSSAQLQNLKSETEYALKIKTILVNNVQTESGQFKFKTPKVERNPIQRVDVIYSHEVNSVRLQWMLESHVNVDQVAGYDVYISEDKERPDSQWRLVRLDSMEAALSLHDLKSSTVYFVRVNLRNRDGSVVRAPSIYRFKTIDWVNVGHRQRVNPFE